MLKLLNFKLFRKIKAYSGKAVYIQGLGAVS